MQEGFFTISDNLVKRHYKTMDTQPEYRTAFMRDRDRIMYSTAFRRLAGKTQIYTIGSDDHKRNRLTHTLEVAQIARTICRALHLNEDLAEAIALAHDLGHTPFGHAGERMLHQLMIPGANCIKNAPFNMPEDHPENPSTISADWTSQGNIFGFKHNLQSVRVATLLEDSYRDNNSDNVGLNLTNYTLWGIMHHSNEKYDTSDAYPNYQKQFEPQMKVANHDSEAWSFEAFVVKISDDIAQWHHDLEDAIRGGALPIWKICETIQKSLESSLSSHDSKMLDTVRKNNRLDRKCVADLSHIVVNTLVSDLVETSRNNMALLEDVLTHTNEEQEPHQISELMYTDYEATLARTKTYITTRGLKPEDLTKENIIAFSTKIKDDSFKSIIKGAVHHSREVERMNAKGEYIIRKLFEAYVSHPQQLTDGPILHFMVEIGKYSNIDEAREVGIGEARMLFDSVIEKNDSNHQIVLMRRICDHIASMTDRYAIEEYNNLYG